MIQLAALLTFSTVLALSSAQEGKKHSVGFTKVPANENLQVKPRSLEERQTCSGTCAECFGSGYTLCPGSSLFCYKPGDPLYGLDSCSGSSTGSDSTDTYTSSSYVPTSTGSAGDSNFCSGTTATCVTCFGAGYLDCGDGINCYNPDDPSYDTCPGGSTSSSGSGSSSSGTTTSSCESQYGAGAVPCGDDACYNPDDGESCCAEGYYCDKGETCSDTVGKCCTGSDSSCSNSGGSGLLTSLLTSSTSTSTGSSTFSTSNFSGGSGSSSSSSGDDNNSSGSVSGAVNLDMTVSKIGALAVGAFGIVILAL